MTEYLITPTAPPDWLDKVESVNSVATHPLLRAGRVLVVGQGGSEADADKITALGQALDAEVGYSRARVMNGGFDADRVTGISGHLLSPDVCIVAGASGAAALMAGVRQSRFVVAMPARRFLRRRMSGLSMTGYRCWKSWSAAKMPDGATLIRPTCRLQNA